MSYCAPHLVISASLLLAAAAIADTHTKTELLPLGEGVGFLFKDLPKPSSNDAATGAKITIAGGERDYNSGSVGKLNDGRVPTKDDQPGENFFFKRDTTGRLLMDLGKAISVAEIRTYSRHTGPRAPQVYTVYAAEGSAAGFNPQLPAEANPLDHGWALIGKVDTRLSEGNKGGTYGVSITAAEGTLGSYRHLLFDVTQTSRQDGASQTFYSEIDVIDADGPKLADATEPQPPFVFTSPDGKYRFSIDTSGAPDLAGWAVKELSPVIRDWYPRIVEMLPSEGFRPPQQVALEFRDDMGGTPASAAGNRVNCNTHWFRRSLQGEARGAVVHELVHVVQQYGRSKPGQNVTRPPGWVVEGLADYIRWYLYEPEKRGAEVSAGALPKARYDASYRTSANFIHWATATYIPDLPRKLNEVARAGRYTDQVWKDLTGKTVLELGSEWKKVLEQRIAAVSPTNSRN